MRTHRCLRLNNTIHSRKASLKQLFSKRRFSHDQSSSASLSNMQLRLAIPLLRQLPKRTSRLSGPTSSSSVESLTTPPAKGLGNLEGSGAMLPAPAQLYLPRQIPAELKDNESPDSRGKESIFAWGSNTKRDSSVGVVTTLQAGWPTNLGSIQDSGKKRFSSQHPNWLWNATRLLPSGCPWLFTRV